MSTTPPQQALDLLGDKMWKELSDDDKIRQVPSGLAANHWIPDAQSASSRSIAFARAFADAERSLNFIYDNGGSFRLSRCRWGFDLSDLGFDEAIFGARWWGLRFWGGGARLASAAFGKHMPFKTFNLQNLCRNNQPNKRLSV